MSSQVERRKRADQIVASLLTHWDHRLIETSHHPSDRIDEIDLEFRPDGHRDFYPEPVSSRVNDLEVDLVLLNAFSKRSA